MARATDGPPRARGFAVVVSVAMLATVLWPLVRGTDGFPLSNYPMFATKKAAVARIFHVVGFTAAGKGRPLAPEMLNTDEVMQASQTSAIAVRAGARASGALCQRVAARLVDERDYDDIARVEVRVDDFDAVAYFAGDRSSRRGRAAARCVVERP